MVITKLGAALILISAIGLVCCIISLIRDLRG